MKLWPRDIIRQVLTIKDSPDAVARGIGIGVFLSFTPLYGLKTLLALVLAALCRGNKVAAVIGVNLHDVVLPLIPAMLGIEYGVGFWVMSQPHHWPASLNLIHLPRQEWLHWRTFFEVGTPILLGSLLIGIPCGCAAFFVARQAFRRAKRPT